MTLTQSGFSLIFFALLSKLVFVVHVPTGRQFHFSRAPTEFYHCCLLRIDNTTQMWFNLQSPSYVIVFFLSIFRRSSFLLGLWGCCFLLARPLHLLFLYTRRLGVDFSKAFRRSGVFLRPTLQIRQQKVVSFFCITVFYNSFSHPLAVIFRVHDRAEWSTRSKRKQAETLVKCIGNKPPSILSEVL